ncbi:AsmA family protein [Azorhizophilus paspali]|uniref:AsmA family protein n=1 Tax=Azorhizophilus paspali TaxID=69963 RepID=A0ABV6SPW0_AZOPA
MTRSGKILVWGLGTLAALIATLVVLVATFDWNRLKPRINAQVSEALKRPFAIEGDLRVNWRRPAEESSWRAWLPWPWISAEALRLGNPDWAEGERFVSLERVELSLSPLALLGRTVRIPQITLGGPEASLQRLADGRANWTFEQGDEAEDKKPSPWTLDIGTVQFDRALVRLDDRVLKADLQVEVTPLGAPIPFAQIVGEAQAGRAAQGGGQPQDYAFAWKAQGRYQGQPLSGEGKVGGLLALQDSELPFPVQVDLRAGKSRLRAEGTLVSPRTLSALDLRLSLSGDSLADLHPLIGVTLPDTAAYSTEGRLSADLRAPDGAEYRYRDFSGKVGDSDIHGDLAYVAGKPRPKLSGELTSKQLLFRDLGPLIGADTGTKRKESKQPPDKALPVEEFRTERWRDMDADVRFEGKRIVRSKELPITDLSAHVHLENGRLRLEPLRLGVAGGRLDTTIVLDGRRTPLDGQAQVSIRGLELKRLFPTVETMRDSLGELNGDANLRGTGNSVAALLGSAGGELKLLIDDGTISRALMELAGLNVGSYVVERLFGDDEVPINCAAADIGFKNGLATPRLFVFDTENAVINIDGSVDFKSEAMDLDIVPKSKGVRIISLRSPLYVRGTFKNPDPGVHAEGLIARGAGMAVLGAAVAPVAGLLALIAPSSGEPNKCGPLLEQMKTGRAD